MDLGPFEILGVLGEGGSGVVHAARWGHREVALKVLRSEVAATDRERQRFLTEARLLAEIDHPSVVKVLAVGTLADGRPYLAMEKLEGETLAQRLARGALPLGEALALFAQLCDAVAALHARGLVHRDLKPENVFLTGGDRYAVLLDLGIAKELDAPASTVTQDGGVRGTPAYMAPERFFGQPAGTHTDIYELGVVLYAMLVGRLPWRDDDDPHARLDPARPSDLGVALPAPLEVAILRALSTRPEARPATAAAFRAAVEEAAGGAVAHVRRTVALRGPAAKRRRVSLAAAAAVAAVAALAAAAVWQGTWRRGSSPLPEQPVTPRRITFRPPEVPLASPVISHDGQTVAVLEAGRIVVYPVIGGDARRIPLPDGLVPREIAQWHPDGDRVVIAHAAGAGEWLWSTVAIPGGEVEPLPGCPGHALAIASDGEMACAIDRTLWRFDAAGRKLDGLVTVASDEDLYAIAWAPDGSRVAVVIRRADATTRLIVVARSGDPTPVDTTGVARITGARWIPAGLFLTANVTATDSGITTLWRVPPDGHRPEQIAALERAASVDISRDGRRLVYLRLDTQWDVHVGRLEQDGRTLAGERRLTLDDRDDIPTDWRPDGRAILFQSTRRGDWDLFEQGLDEVDVRPVVVGATDDEQAASVAGGEAILFARSAGADTRLARLASAEDAAAIVPGLPAQRRTGWRVYVPTARCPSRGGAPCVHVEVLAGELIFRTVEETPRVVARIAREQPGAIAPWGIDPDGKRLVVNTADDLVLVDLATGRSVRLEARDCAYQYVAWTHDGAALFATCQTAGTNRLLRVETDGSAHVLWENTGSLFVNPLPSPDGQHLAVGVRHTDTDLWLVEDFQ